MCACQIQYFECDIYTVANVSSVGLSSMKQFKNNCVQSECNAVLLVTYINRMFLLKIQVFEDVTPCGLVKIPSLYTPSNSTQTLCCKIQPSYSLRSVSVCLYLCGVSHSQVGVVKSMET